MFFQTQSSQKSADYRTETELSKVQSGLAAAKEREESQIPRLYQKEDIFAQGAQTITAISQNTVFRGNIDTKDDIAVFGRLEGNIINGASIRISGAVKGDIHCDSLQACDGVVEGNVLANGEVELSQSSRIVGNLQCDFAVISGTITGDVVAVHGVTLHQTAVVNGNLQAVEIEVHKGARFNGMIQMEKQNTAAAAISTPAPAKSLPPKITAEPAPAEAEA